MLCPRPHSCFPVFLVFRPKTQTHLHIIALSSHSPVNCCYRTGEKRGWESVKRVCVVKRPRSPGGIQGAEPSTHLPPFLLCFRLSRWCLRGKEPSPVADTLPRDGALSAASTGCEPADTQARLAARVDRLFLPGSGDEEAGRTNTLKGFGPRWSYRTSAVGEARAFSESEREAGTRDGCGALATGHGEACHPGS